MKQKELETFSTPENFDFPGADNTLTKRDLEFLYSDKSILPKGWLFQAKDHFHLSREQVEFIGGIK